MNPFFKILTFSCHKIHVSKKNFENLKILTNISYFFENYFKALQIFNFCKAALQKNYLRLNFYQNFHKITNILGQEALLELGCKFLNILQKIWFDLWKNSA